VRDDEFLQAVTDALAGLPGVEAVALGGSRAQRTNRPDSDWDLAVYYRGHFNPQTLRDLGWDGEVSELGGWGGGVFNGGAWLTVDGRRVDVHYRDLDVIDHELAEARTGRFHIEPLMFHLAGIPSYLVIGELAINRVLTGTLPKPEYPEALRRAASETWSGRARLHLEYAKTNYAARGRVAQCAALLVVAASEFAHAILAARGEWVTNEKTLLSRAGLGGLDELVASMTTEPVSLLAAIEGVRELARANGVYCSVPNP
jgi:predicted nucleotidyltransferase